MGYLALYRRFRPTTFDKVIGQNHITTTLINQIKTDKIGHAYLFCGARGTGKTSTAKIFARAINCLSPVNGSPCGKCKNCLALEGVNSPDVFEIDAASNNKVENIRELRDKISYPPVTGKYKVYIIDEVHMLTGEAFNALLKTLEEPPSHAVFILATTEAHKIPATILSRCMRFDFRLVENSELVKLVSGIFDEIGRSYTLDAVKHIARSGEGCVRDTLSVAEICVSFCEGEITLDKVLSVLGATDDSVLIKLADGILSGDSAYALKETDSLIKSGKGVGTIFKDLTELLRETVIATTSSDNFLAMPEEKFAELKALGEKHSVAEILRIMEILAFAEGEIRYSSQPRILLETAILKASAPKADYDVSSLAVRVAELEKRLERILSGQEAIGTSPRIEESFYASVPVREVAESNGPRPSEKKAEKVEKQPVKESKVEKPPVKESEERPQTKPTLDDKKVWGTVIRALRRTSITLYAVCSERIAEVKDGKLIVYADSEGNYNMLTKPENLEILRKTVESVCSLETVIAETSEEKQREDKIDEQYKQVVELFGKNKIVD